jgi:Ca2+-binding EF-hand superfamily protein
LSKHFKFGEVLNEAVGTPYTVAPEVIRGQYDERCDCWAIGVITYLLLSGDPPFGGCGGPEPLLTVRANILKGSFHFEPEEIWSIVSPQARAFISSLLVVDPKLRPTARESQRHTWLREWANRTRKEDDNILNPNVVKALVSFKEFSDMRKLLCEVLSFTLLPDQIKDLRKEFEKMDTDGSGEISLEALKQVLMTNAGAGSLGALTETEVEDIFNAMRVRKTETRIHWHEFIAAGLSQCQVDDRNLRLAFDRLDSDHKGYITFDNVMDLMGNDAIQSEDAMRRMWGDSMRACNSSHARITYDDFILLMKGQTREVTEVVPEMPIQAIPAQTIQPMLGVVHETKTTEEATTGDSILILPNGEQILITESISASDSGKVSARRGSWGAGTTSNSNRSLGTPPITPVSSQGLVTQITEIDLPLTMDDDDEDERPLTLMMSEKTQNIMRGSPVAQSPMKGTPEYVTPLSERKGVPTIPNMHALGLLPSIEKPEPYIRRRSRSVDDQDPDYVEDDEPPSFGADARRAMLLPEHDHKESLESITKDEALTPLVANRQLYRAHRQMRQAVLDATKRFDEQQAIRAREILMAQRDDDDEKGNDVGPVGAGLVLRHGLKRQVSTEAVGTWLKKTKEEQAALVQKANRRCGRGRSRRQKTISDMTGMLAGISSDLNEQGMPTDLDVGRSPGSNGSESQPFAPKDAGLTPPSLSDSKIPVDITTDNALEDFPPLRNATVPGVFIKTKDPFGEGGRYGLLGE